MSPLVSPWLLLAGIGMILVAICGVWWSQHGRPALWPAVWWGALAWTVSIVLKVAAAWPTRGLIHRHTHDPLTWLYIGLLTGIFECAIPLWLIVKSRLRRADWDQALAFGAGFGAIEAVLLGLAALVPVLLLLVAPNAIPIAVRDAWVREFETYGVGMIVAPVVERAAALLIHIWSSVLLIYAVRTCRWRWFWLAFVYKTAVDGVAGWASLTWNLKESPGRVVELELLAVLFALIGLAALPGLKAAFARLDHREESSATNPQGCIDARC